LQRLLKLTLCGGVVIALVWAAAGEGPRRQFKLQSESPEFFKLIPSDAKLEVLATGFGFTEGPVWDPRGFVYVSDEEVNKIFRVYPDGHKDELIALGDPDGNTYDAEHQLIDCASVLRAIIRIKLDGTYAVLAERYEGKRFNSPNDVVMGPDGAFYFTDPTSDLPKGQKQELDFQGVFRLDAKGQVTLLTKELSQPNGLAFSPDGKRLYVDDSEKRNIRVYDFQPDGTLRNGRIFGEEPGRKGDGVPDGMKLDRLGNVYVTGPQGIWIWNPAGNHVGTIVVPEQPANLAWGDSDLKTLYITATTSIYKIKMNVSGFVPYLTK
jgi:gluconolactonase